MKSAHQKRMEYKQRLQIMKTLEKDKPKLAVTQTKQARFLRAGVVYKSKNKW